MLLEIQVYVVVHVMNRQACVRSSNPRAVSCHLDSRCTFCSVSARHSHHRSDQPRECLQNFRMQPGFTQATVLERHQDTNRQHVRISFRGLIRSVDECAQACVVILHEVSGVPQPWYTV